MNKHIAIIGAGGHAKVVYDAIIKAAEYQPVAFIDRTGNKRTSLFDLPVYTDDKLPELKQSYSNLHIIIALGSNNLRCEINKNLQTYDLPLATIIHPSAQIACDVKIGEGTVILAGAIINTSTKIGKNCIINTASSIDHDGNIENYVQISPGVNLAGGVTVGEKTFIGTGASIIPEIIIGSNCIIAAGATVIKNLKDRVMAAGVPATIKKEL